MYRRGVLLVALIALNTGCYRATINTGRTPSGETIQQDWAHSFVAGLVPPSTVETASRCPNGVASVVTQHSFLNMLAQFITFSLYSPMTITVQCAAAGGDEQAAAVTVPAGTGLADATRIFNEAADRAREDGATVLVRFE